MIDGLISSALPYVSDRLIYVRLRALFLTRTLPLINSCLETADWRRPVPFPKPLSSSADKIPSPPPPSDKSVPVIQLWVQFRRFDLGASALLANPESNV